MLKPTSVNWQVETHAFESVVLAPIAAIPGWDAGLVDD